MQRSSLISFLIFLVSLTLGFVFVWPEFNKTDALKSEKTTQENQRENLKDILANIDELSAKYESAQDDIDKLKLAIPSEPQIPELLIQIEDLVKSNGLVLGNIGFTLEGPTAEEGSSQTNGIRIIKLNLNADGTYENLKNLLKDIENNIRLMDVIMFTFGEPDKETGFSKFDISLNAYYLNGK